MRKQKLFAQTRFNANIWLETIDAFKAKFLKKDLNSIISYDVTHLDGATWSYDTSDEFIAELRRENMGANLHLMVKSAEVIVSERNNCTQVTVKAPTRSEIEKLFDFFERSASESRVPDSTDDDTVRPVIFIGHGADPAWRDLKDHLQDKHDLRIVAYETGARGGHTIRDILDDMVESSSFAILVMTCDDEQSDGKYRARQNVIHEAGLFQGRLGFSRALVLSEKGVERFSNLDGVQYFEFSKGNIRETFGDVLATIGREFPTRR